MLGGELHGKRPREGSRVVVEESGATGLLGRALLALRHLFPPAQSLGLVPTREIKPYPEIKQPFSE